MGKKLLVVILSTVLLVAFLTSCASRSKEDSSSNQMSLGVTKGKSVQNSSNTDMAYGEEQSDAKVKSGANVEAPKQQADSEAITGNGLLGQNSTNTILEQRKIIRSANVSVEVENFDVAYGKINSFILGIGFVQESNITTDKVYVAKDQKYKPLKRGTIIIRVDRQKFDKVLGNIKGIGDILNESMGTDDVTDKFYDTESHLRLLKYEQERLEIYLRKIEDVDKILKTESRLTELRHDIESLTGTLKKLNDLVELSTITINMNEKSPVSNEDKKPPTYLEKLGQNINESVSGAVMFCGDLLIFLIRALPTLILLAILCFIALAVYRKYLKPKDTYTKKKDDNTPM